MKKQDPTESPLYTVQDRAIQELRRRILQGVYPPGVVLPSERQLSQEIGISRPVIRAALATLSEEGLVIRNPGHRPSVAPSISKQEAVPATPINSLPLQAIAAVLPLDRTYRAAYDIQHGIQRTLLRRQSSYRLVVYDLLAGVSPRSTGIQYHADQERQILESIANEGLSGVILWQTGGSETMPAIAELKKKGVPVVFVDRYPNMPGAPLCDFVGMDNRSGAREAVNYLIGLGHERIAHLTFPPESSESQTFAVRERYEGYREALRENGLVFDESLIGTSSYLTQKLKDQIDSGNASTAIFAVNDASAHRIIELLAEINIRVPEDISVIGFDDQDRYSLRAPHLTSVYVPFEGLGEYAAETLLQRLTMDSPQEESAATLHTLLSTRLVVRGTCRERDQEDNEPLPQSPPSTSTRNGVA